MEEVWELESTWTGAGAACKTGKGIGEAAGGIATVVVIGET